MKNNKQFRGCNQKRNKSAGGIEKCLSDLFCCFRHYVSRIPKNYTEFILILAFITYSFPINFVLNQANNKFEFAGRFSIESTAGLRNDKLLFPNIAYMSAR